MQVRKQLVGEADAHFLRIALFLSLLSARRRRNRDLEGWFGMNFPKTVNLLRT